MHAAKVFVCKGAWLKTNHTKQPLVKVYGSHRRSPHTYNSQFLLCKNGQVKYKYGFLCELILSVKIYLAQPPTKLQPRDSSTE